MQGKPPRFVHNAAGQDSSLPERDNRAAPWLRQWGLGALTFDMRGGRKQAKPDCGRPLDGRVRAPLLTANLYLNKQQAAIP